jgi:hypothetical protein
VQQAYWFEPRRKAWAKRVLSCIVGLTAEQKEKILHGDATIVKAKEGMIFSLQEDVEFKKRLKEQLEFIESQYIKIGGRRVRHELIERYAEQVVKRLRDAMRAGVPSAVHIGYLLDLELERQRLHEEILVSVGFTKNKREGEAYRTFRDALFEFLDAVSGPVEAL